MLNPEYEPSNTITSTDTAIDILDDVALSLPTPISPYCDLLKWKRITDLFTPTIYTALADICNNPYDKYWKTLSMRTDPNTSITAGDIIHIHIDSSVDDSTDADGYVIQTGKDDKEHIESSLQHALVHLPPVTAGLLSTWVSEISVYGSQHYKTEILPADKEYNGLHIPHSQVIQVIDRCFNDIHDRDDAYPVGNGRGSVCKLWHELGHPVHTIYGFHRPGDNGYKYPNKRGERTSTGHITDVELSDRQSRMVYEMYRSYALTHREEFDAPDRTGYSKTHPTEGFTCAFEKLLRFGSKKIVSEHEQYIRPLKLMV